MLSVCLLFDNCGCKIINNISITQTFSPFFLPAQLFIVILWQNIYMD